MPPRRKREQKQKKEEDEAQINPSAMTVAQLKAELTKKKLETTGKKADLVKRLKEALEDKLPPTKKVATEEPETEETDGGKEEESSSYGKMAAALKKTEKKKRQPKVDQFVPWNTNYLVHSDWDCMLNQTNIGQNNNKFYVLQLLTNKQNSCYYVWTRWGRVGEAGANAMKGPLSVLSKAEQEFKKKFKDKTKNDWNDRDNFEPVPGKYTMIDMGDEDDDDENEGDVPMETEETDAPPSKIKKCTLDMPTQTLIKLLFDNDMFRDAMKSMDIDTKKMPLGKLSKVQIAKGFESLEAIETALQSKASRAKLSELSSKFYTIIPHNFGRKIPPVMDNQEMVQRKFDMLMVLGDIEIAQTMQKDKKAKVEAEEVPHPLDVDYKSLNTKLDHIDKSEHEYKVIQKYLASTGSSYQKLEIIDVWKIDRDYEGMRFAEHHDIENRRLLWHGTNVAVVAAILKTGLRIMPHSGGRVGCGIYFASENSKSAGYVRCAQNTGIMFLAEVALGKEHEITSDNCSLRKAPNGYDCVVARGHTEPDPKNDVTLKIETNDVTVPQGAPISMPKYSSSSFSQSEYLVYKESQVRIRYMLKLKFGGYHW